MGRQFQLSLKYTMPWGEEYTGASLVDMYLAELAAHVRDLATATDRSTGWIVPSPCRRSRGHGP